MKTGIVKFFDELKGFGFISYDENDEIFVHFSDIVDEEIKVLVKDQHVSFIEQETKRGKVAKNVQKIIE